MSRAPKQRKVQLHYQPYQPSSGANNALDSSGLLANNSSNSQSQSHDYGLSDLMDPVLTGYSSNLSRNLWDDWNEHDPNLVKFDMFGDESMGATTATAAATTNTTASANATGGFMASVLANQPPLAPHQQHQQHQHQQHQQQPMDVDGRRAPTANGFHALSQPRLSVKRSLSEDLVSMLDDDDSHDHDHDHDPMAPPPRRGLGFGGQQLQPQQPQAQNLSPGGQQLLVQHATDWLNGFPAASMPPHEQQPVHQQHAPSPHPQAHPDMAPPPQPLSPTSAARLEAHNQRPEPSPMERASAAIASTLVAIPNPCKESAPPATSTATTPAIAANTVTPSPFSAFSFMNAAMETAKSTSAGEGSSEGDKMNSNPFANAGMMMPGFMMYSMPMMGNYHAAAAAAAAMGMMPMGAMQMGPMGMPMGGMQMNPMGMPMGAMGMGGMQMGMPIMPMAAASMGMPMAAMGAGVPLATTDTSGDATMKTAITPKTLQPKGPTPAVLAPAGGGATTAANASFVSIARKPEEPEVSNILKSLMEEEAKKKEKKLERNRDSARESRKKQQTYVETLENGIKRLQINRDLVVSYRWGVTGGPHTPNAVEWTERVSIISGRSEAFSTLQNPANFQNLMRINRQRRALSLSREEKERGIFKCFMAVGKQLAGLRVRILKLQVFRNLSNPASAASQELAKVLQLSEEQRLQLECHSNRVFDQQVLSMVKLFKVFFALRAQAIRLNLLSPELEQYFRDVCSMEQLQKLLQWTELHRPMIQGDGAHGLRLISTS